MRLHITEEMVDAALAAIRQEAINDGNDPKDLDDASPLGQARFREVIRAALQAAADTIR